MKKLLIKFKCWYRGHYWVSAATKGIPPTPEQVKSVEGFKEYATMYCDRCGKISELNKRLHS